MNAAQAQQQIDALLKHSQHKSLLRFITCGSEVVVNSISRMICGKLVAVLSTAPVRG